MAETNDYRQPVRGGHIVPGQTPRGESAMSWVGHGLVTGPKTPGVNPRAAMLTGGRGKVAKQPAHDAYSAMAACKMMSDNIARCEV